MLSGKGSISSTDSAQSYFMEQRATDGSGLILGLLSLFALLFGALVFGELIIPFQTKFFDLLVAIAAAVVGVTLSLTAIFRRNGALVLNIVALAANLSALCAAIAID